MEPVRVPRPGDPEGGVALILVLLFTVLLYVITAELVTSARLSRLAGENDTLLAKMQSHTWFTLTQVEQALKDDLTAGAASGGAEGGQGSVPGLPMPGGAGGPGGSGGEGESADSSQDSWYEPTAYADGDITAYVWVEDENRKFNLLALASPDEEFARESRERFVRLIDVLREDTPYDMSTADGSELAESILEWLRGRNRNEAIPRPPLKSDDPERADVTIPLHLDELLLLRNVTEDIFFDKIYEKRLVQGLEAVLTISTSMKFDPGDPTKKDKPQQRTNRPPATNQPANSTVNSGSGSNTGSTGNNPTGANPTPQPSGTGANKQPEQPQGEGIKINVNTATRPVLRCLFSESDLPDAVIEAILKYRNEDEPEQTEEGAEGGAQAPAPGTGGSSYSEDLETGEQKKKRIFKSLQDLEQVPEFQNLSNVEVKAKLTQLLTTKSDTFSIHVAAMVKRSEEARVYVIQRRRQIVMRLEGSEEPILAPLVPLESRTGLRLKPTDFPEDEDLRRSMLDEMDSFSREEREWNPFFIEFWLPKEGG